MKVESLQEIYQLYKGGNDRVRRYLASNYTYRMIVQFYYYTDKQGATFIQGTKRDYKNMVNRIIAEINLLL